MTGALLADLEQWARLTSKLVADGAAPRRRRLPWLASRGCRAGMLGDLLPLIPDVPDGAS